MRKKLLANSNKSHSEDEIKIVCLVSSNNEEDMDKWMTVQEVIDRLKGFEFQSKLYGMNNKSGCICNIINVFDGNNNDGCEKHNIPKDYNGTVTNFLT